MEHRGLAPRPVQQADRSGRVRHRRTKRERNQARASRGPSAGGPRVPRARPRCSLAHRDPTLGPPAPQPVIITQGRLSRAHRGLLGKEVKSLNVDRLLSGLAEEVSSPPARETPAPEIAATAVTATAAATAAAAAAPLPVAWDEEPTQGLPPKGKENEAPGGPTPELPSPRTLLEELQGQLHLPGAFPRRSLVQEARAEIIGALLAHNGELPDLSQVLRGLREQGAGPEPQSPEEWQMVPQDREPPDQQALMESRRRRRRKGKRELMFTLGATPSPPSTEKSLVLPPDPWVPSPSPPPLPLGSERGETTWGPQTSFDVLKSIWLPATPPTCAPPWQWGAGGTDHPPACLPNSEALDWSPSPPAPMPGLPWFVSRSSPEPWTFPRMRLY
ncbi:proline-rich protein 19 [Gracilinanus agilis]|uniref:proline-rich protein 19 n=1 Tax=Gracilinanus agilis TaxID=191870 RepID=UPI001CFC7AE2|nr:proline-rich protein 19 [Gracilinanus agilis]